MKSTIYISISCYDWEKSKVEVLLQLSNAIEFLNKLNNNFNVTLMDAGNPINEDKFSDYLENFKMDIEKVSLDDADGIITFSDISNFPKNKGDIEEGEIEFNDSLSLCIAYGNTVDCIAFKMSINMSSDDAQYEIESLFTDYGLIATINDESGNYLDECKI